MQLALGTFLTACKALQAGAEFNDKGYAYYDVCAISEAARSGSLEALKLLLDHAVSTSSDFTLSAIKQTYSGWTPLLLAATYGHAEVARVLLDNGLDPNVSDSSFRTPLYMACLDGYAPVVDVLLENPNTRVNPLNKSDYIPLYEAVFRGDVGIAAALLAHGAHVKPTEEWGWTPLHSATIRKNVEMLRLFDGRRDLDLPSRDKSPLQ